MLRKVMVALSVLATVALAAPDTASARGGFGFRGGAGWHGGWHGGGWRGPGIGAIGVGLGIGLAAPYAWGGYGPGYYGYATPAYYNGYGYDYGYPVAAGYDYGDGGCTLTTRRVWTPFGWRLQRLQVCGY